MYDVIDLGTLQGYNSSEGLCLNSQGQVVGYCSPDANLGYPRRAFLWSNGNMVDLGTLGGQESIGYSVNNQGLVVGVSETIQSQRHAFTWSQAAGIKDLGIADQFSAAFGINNQGSVIGRHGGDQLSAVGFLRSAAGVLQDIAGVAGHDSSGPLALNEKNEVTGWYREPAFPSGFFWSGGNLIDFGPPHDWYPTAVNFSGTVVGNLGGVQGFQWKSGVITWLNPLLGDTNCYARCINDVDFIVGGSFDANGQPILGRATISIGPLSQDLNTLTAPKLAMKMVSANWITNSGAITGRGWVNGGFHAFMVQPRDPLEELDIGMHRAHIAVFGLVPVDGSGIGITADGHIIPIPWTGPHPIMRRLSSAIDRLLRSIHDPKMRQQVEARVFAAIEEAIRKETEKIK